MYCGHCQRSNDDSATTCARCGLTLHSSVQPGPAASWATAPGATAQVPGWGGAPQPGFWPSGPPVGPPQLRRLSGVSTATVALLALGAVLAVVAAGSALAQAALMRRVLDGVEVTDNEILASDVRLGVTGIIQLGVRIATIVLFLMWFTRVYDNAKSVAPRRLRHSPGWAVGSWFVPILNLFRPAQMVFDSWRASGPLGERDGVHAVPAVFGVWWALWLVMLAAERVDTRVTLAAETPEQLISASTVTVWVSAIEIAASVAAILVVRRLTGRQRERGVEFGQPV